MAKLVSPLVGFNNNVRHKSRLFHIQTEDSGVNRPHVITHLFMDGGRILKSVKTSYAEHVGTDAMTEVVRQMMKAQHKAMFIALRDGQFDLLAEPSPAPPGVRDAAPAPAPDRAPPAVEAAPEAAAEGVAASAEPEAPPAASELAIARSQPRAAGEGGRYAPARPAAIFGSANGPPARSIFSDDLVSDRSLDEVILSYLAADLEPPRRQ